MGNNPKITSSGQNDVIIHQLRVELEEIKHHIHTTVMQMNILTNKMINSEDKLFELKQRDLIVQKQTLDSNQEQLAKIEKKLDKIIETEGQKEEAFKRLEDDVKTQAKALHQNKKKIHEIEKQALSLKQNPA
jgi:chromosome segregation ATPase